MKEEQNEFLVVIQKVLEVGMVKKYKELCQLLQQEVKTSDSKKAQVKEWKRYFDFEYVNRKFIITEIYDEPLPKEDGRSRGNNSTYLKHIELLILNYLNNSTGNEASLTIKSILIMLGMINTNYLNDQWKLEEKFISNGNDLTDFHINHFYQRSYKKLNRILFDALKSLKNQRLIDYEEDKIINVDEHGHNTYRKATKEECDRIREIERKVLCDLGLESMVQVHLKFMNKIFYNNVNDILYDKYKIHFYYKQITMRFTPEHVYEALNEAKEKIQQERKSLNTKVIDYMNEQIPKVLKRTEEKYNEKIQELIDESIGKPCPSKAKNIFRIQDEELYRYAQEKLAEYLLRI